MAFNSFTNIRLPAIERPPNAAVSKSDVEAMILNKLDVNSVANAWSSGTEYSAGDYVIDGNVLYCCSGDHSATNSNKPSASDAFWNESTVEEMISSLIDNALAGSGRFTGYITGDGTSRAFTVRHNLNSLLILTEVVDSDGNSVYPNVQRIDADSIQLQFGQAPTAGAVFTVIILC